MNSNSQPTRRTAPASTLKPASSSGGPTASASARAAAGATPWRPTLTTSRHDCLSAWGTLGTGLRERGGHGQDQQGPILLQARSASTCRTSYLILSFLRGPFDAAKTIRDPSEPARPKSTPTPLSSLREHTPLTCTIGGFKTATYNDFRTRCTCIWLDNDKISGWRVARQTLAAGTTCCALCLCLVPDIHDR